MFSFDKVIFLHYTSQDTLLMQITQCCNSLTSICFALHPILLFVSNKTSKRPVPKGPHKTKAESLTVKAANLKHSKAAPKQECFLAVRSLDTTIMIDSCHEEKVRLLTGHETGESISTRDDYLYNN